MPLLLFYKDGFSIKQPMKVDMPLNKETKPYMIISELQDGNKENLGLLTRWKKYQYKSYQKPILYFQYTMFI